MSSANLNSPVLAFISLRLEQAVHSSLAGLNKVLRGSALLTTDVQRLARALLVWSGGKVCEKGSRGECTNWSEDGVCMAIHEQ